MENNTKRERLKELYFKYGLDKEDIFTMTLGGKSIPIVTRTCVEKIMSIDKITLIKKSLSNNNNSSLLYIGLNSVIVICFKFILVLIV